MRLRFPGTVALAIGLSCPAAYGQFMDMALMAKWESVAIVHYEAVGVVTEQHVQIPADDADQYADVEDRVTLSFDWDVKANRIVGTPTITNDPATLGPLSGMGPGCPGGELKGPYEHFDAVALTADGSGAIEITGRRLHPDTQVAESCGSGRKFYKGAEEPVSTYIGPPKPIALAYGAMLGADSPIKITPDGKSMIMTASNSGWVWTFTPTAK